MSFPSFQSSNGFSHNKILKSLPWLKRSFVIQSCHLPNDMSHCSLLLHTLASTKHSSNSDPQVLLLLLAGMLVPQIFTDISHSPYSLFSSMSPHQTGILWPLNLKSNPKLYQYMLADFRLIPLYIIFCTYMCINLLSISSARMQFYEGKKKQKCKLHVTTRH